MKNPILFLLCLLPYSIFAQQNNTAAFEKAKTLYQQALFTKSTAICEKRIPNLGKKEKQLHLDFLMLYADNLRTLNRLDESLTTLALAKSKLKKKKSIQYLKLLNSFGKTYFFLSDCEGMKQSLDKAISLFEGKTTDNALAETYDYLGTYWGEMGATKLAISYFEKAKKIRVINQGADPLPLHRSAIFMSLAASMKGDYAGSIKILKEGNDIIDNNGGNYFQKADILLSLGSKYAAIGDFDTAIRYIEEGFHLVEQHQDDAYARMIDFCDVLGQIYRGKKDFATAESYFLQGLKLLEKTPNNYRMGSLSGNYALLLNDEKKYTAAKKRFITAIHVYQKYMSACGWYGVQINQLYGGLATLHYGQGDYPAAMKAYSDNIISIEKYQGKKSPYLTQVFNNMGLSYQSIGQLDSATIYFDFALDILGSRAEDIKMDFSTIISPIEWSYVIWNKAENFELKYQNTKEISDLEKALHYYEVYAYFLDFLRGSYRTESSKIGFAAENKITYEKCIELILALHEKKPNQALYQKTFRYLEKSKSIILHEAFNKTQVKDFGQIPAKMLAKENDLYQAAISAEEKYYGYLSRFGEHSPKVPLAKSEWFKQKKAFNDFLDELKSKHENYFNNKYLPDVTSLAEVQKELLANDKQCILDYYVGTKFLFITFISKTHYKIISLEKDTQLLDKVNKFRNAISSYHGIPRSQRNGNLFSQNMEQYIAYAQELYTYLFAPVVEAGLMKNIKEVIIIPDAELANLPFEALLSTYPSFPKHLNHYPFLIKDYQFSYGYSATLLLKMKHKVHQTPAKKNVLALAPFIERSSGKYGTLPYSKQEVNTIIDLWGGDLVVNAKATKAYFKANCSDYRILQLSTHATANAVSSDNTYLVFAAQFQEKENDFLYMRELYSLELNADMVVLSACETNLGEWQVGEGIISLARAFVYAGTKSILTTLWEMDDLSSKDLMIDFYRQLKGENISKDKALHLAKLHLIQGKNLSFHHPYFWASMIAVGDMRPLEYKK